MSLRRYVGLRRLTRAAQALRDTDVGILEVALVHGFSSQEALTRAFVREWGDMASPPRRKEDTMTTIPMWQRHDPEGMGQAWCRVVPRR